MSEKLPVVVVYKWTADPQKNTWRAECLDCKWLADPRPTFELAHDDREFHKCQIGSRDTK